MSKRNREALREVACWKIDANLENNNRYFYKTFEVDMLLKGDKSYVIGRKGTGKTAIAKFLVNKLEFNYFSKSISLKNFPFNELYPLKDESYTSPNEYISIWKYLIYIEILYLMQSNQSLSQSTRTKIEELLPQQPKIGLARKIRDMTSREFKIGAKFIYLKHQSSEKMENLSWVEKIDILENFILENLDNCKYFIIFDELDEDYTYQSSLEPTGKYLELIAGLFKAVQHVKSFSIENKFNINPVIFLRDDIYDLITDHDKTKWSDLVVYLRWTKYTIKSLIAYRLSKAKHPMNEVENFGKIWSYYFSSDTIGVGGNREKQISMYEWIARETMLRPRDFIKFIQLCAKQAYEANYHEIRSYTVTTQDLTYSSYFRSELVDEIHSIIPEINTILESFSKVGKAYLSIDEFKLAYEEVCVEYNIPNKNYKFILQVLFNFSVIGNHDSDTNKLIFRYINKEANLNFNHGIAIHRGLYKSLQLF